jgi:uncharacterized protein
MYLAGVEVGLMQVNVSQLLKEPVGSSRDYEISGTVDIAGDSEGRPAQGTVTMVRTPQGILVRGELRAELELTCGRCLGAFGFPVAIDIEEEFTPTVDVNSGVPLPQPEETGAFAIDEHHVIDLSEAMRQYAMLAVPMKPLCRANCAGLCQECGCDLNQRACGCVAQTLDPRWSVLSKLL